MASPLNPFGANAMAAGYARSRPPVHPRVLEVARPVIGPVDRGLHVGCSAGISTRALQSLAPHSIGMEPTESMLGWSREIGANSINGVSVLPALRETRREAEKVQNEGMHDPWTVDDLHTKWMKKAKYRREYQAMEQEFALSAALIGARARAGFTQEQVARRMKTTQAVIARLEGGGSTPSTRTLQKDAKATGTRLRISFEPAGSARPLF